MTVEELLNYFRNHPQVVIMSEDETMHVPCLVVMSRNTSTTVGSTENQDMLLSARFELVTNGAPEKIDAR